MEEQIYKRQILKLAVSKLVVDMQQTSRHYEADEMVELYSTKNIEPKCERQPYETPKDHILAALLNMHSDIIYKYHCHDSLLTNEEDESLTDAERELAWKEFELEKNQILKSRNSAYPELEIGIYTFLITSIFDIYHLIVICLQIKVQTASNR